MINRTFDPEIIKAALALYPFEPIEMNVGDWLSNLDNIAMTDEDGNVGLFEAYLPKVYTGHYFFKARGKTAKDLSVLMLDAIFSKYDARAIRGLTPTEHRAARVMAHHLGFTPYGELETTKGPHVIYVMTKHEFISKSGKVNG